MAQTHRKSGAGGTDIEFEFVHDLVRQHACAHPNQLAVVDSDGTGLSYGQLAERCRRLAGVLLAHGVGPDVPVVVRLPRSADLIVSLLAILDAGGVYVPIDDTCPPARFAAILRSLGAGVLVTDLRAADDAAGQRMITVQPDVEADGPDPVPSGRTGPMPDSLAYVLHTSGSTGVPKGVAMTHRGLNRLIQWQIDDGPRALNTLNFTPIGFDVTFQEVLSTLAAGGRLYLVSEQVRRDPERLLTLMAERSIERLFLPYVALQQLANAAQRTDVLPRSLRHVITAGERLVITKPIMEFFRRLPECRLDNHYGPTETHLVTRFSLRTEEMPWPTFPAIGSPVSGAEVYLLDGDLRPVPTGEEGELYVGGPALARGYTHAPDQSAERFLPDPFTGHPGERMYRTGDIAWADAGGVVHFVGRADNQVKIRGYRVEPAEVESVLAGLPGVRNVAVGTRTLTGDVRVLVAYLVPDGAVPDVTGLADHLRATLPSYLVPSRFVFLAALPLTATGKVDYRALESVVLPAASGTSERPESLVDIVAAVWQRVLGHDQFTPDDDFFDVGGDSLLATWVVTELGQALGRELHLSLLLEQSTVAELAERLTELGAGPELERRDSEILTLRAGPSNRVLYLFPALGGELFAYRELVKEMTAPLRVLGVRWAGEDTGVPASVPELAQVHAAQIRALQPHGPYLLGGWSFGGVLAFEVARQLVDAGETVEFLGLLDANPVRDPISGLLPGDTPYFDMLSSVIEDIDARGLADNGPIEVSEYTDNGTWTALMGAAGPSGLSVRHLRRSLLVARRSMCAAMHYRPAPYPGDVDLFQAAVTRSDIQDRLVTDLRTVVRGTLTTHVISGDHSGMLTRPQVSELVTALDEALGSWEKVSNVHGSQG